MNPVLQGQQQIKQWAATMQSALSHPFSETQRLSTEDTRYKYRRLALYQELVRTNLADFIDAVFPISKSIASPTEWDMWIDHFASSSEHTSPLFREISEQFLSCLNTSPSLHIHPALLALMRWEWLEMVVEIDNATVLETSATIKKLNPTLRVETFDYPVHTMANRGQLEPASPTVLFAWRVRDHSVHGLCPNEALLQFVLYLYEIEHNASPPLLIETWDAIQNTVPLKTLADELMMKDILL
jgi:hypothetical protein